MTVGKDNNPVLNLFPFVMILHSMLSVNSIFASGEALYRMLSQVNIGHRPQVIEQLCYECPGVCRGFTGGHSSLQV